MIALLEPEDSSRRLQSVRARRRLAPTALVTDPGGRRVFHPMRSQQTRWRTSCFIAAGLLAGAATIVLLRAQPEFATPQVAGAGAADELASEIRSRIAAGVTFVQGPFGLWQTDLGEAKQQYLDDLAVGVQRLMRCGTEGRAIYLREIVEGAGKQRRAWLQQLEHCNGEDVRWVVSQLEAAHYSPAERLPILRAIWLRDPEPELDQVVRFMDGADERARGVGVLVLERIGTPAAIALVQKLSHSDPEATVRGNARAVLARLAR